MSSIAAVQTTLVLNPTTQALYVAPTVEPVVSSQEVPGTNTLAASPLVEPPRPPTPPPVPVPGEFSYPVVIDGVAANTATMLYGTGTGTAVNTIA